MMSLKGSGGIRTPLDSRPKRAISENHRENGAESGAVDVEKAASEGTAPLFERPESDPDLVLIIGRWPKARLSASTLLALRYH